jgi:hypothetical protein
MHLVWGSLVYLRKEAYWGNIVTRMDIMSKAFLKLF